MTHTRSLRPDARLVQLHAERSDPGARLADAFAQLEEAHWGVLLSGEVALARQLAALLGAGTLRVDGRLNISRSAMAQAGLAVADLYGDLKAARAAWLFEPDDRAIERARRAGVKIIVDATLSPGGGWPLRGADYVVYRDGVTLTGHADAPLAALFGTGTPPEVVAPAPSDLSVSLALRDVATLPLRLARAARTVTNVAERLGGSARAAGPTALLLAPDAAPDTVQPLGGVMAATRAVPEGVLLTPGLEDTEQVLALLRLPAATSAEVTPPLPATQAAEPRRDDEARFTRRDRDERRGRFERRGERERHQRPERFEAVRAERASQAAPDELGSDELGSGQLGSGQLGSEQVAADQAASGQAGPRQADWNQARSDQLGAQHASVGQPGASQLGAGQSGAGQLGAGPSSPARPRADQARPDRPLQTRASQNQAAPNDLQRFTFESPAGAEETWEPEIVFSDIARTAPPLTHTVSNGPDSPDQQEVLPEVLTPDLATPETATPQTNSAQRSSAQRGSADKFRQGADMHQAAQGRASDAAQGAESASTETPIIAPDLPATPDQPGKEDPGANLTDEQAAIYARLREWRNAEAKRQEISRFIIASNATLAEIARRIPYTGADLRAVRGMGPERMKKYGDKILEVVRG